MLIKIKRGWEKPERAVTPEHLFWNRRRLIKGLAAGPILAGAASLLGEDAFAQAADPSAALYPFKKNDKYKAPRPITKEELAATYNNYYEFGSSKRISEAAKALPLRPWEIKVGGMVEKPFTIGVDDLMKKMPLEERIYAHRCVEAWSMVVPWIGVPLASVLAKVGVQPSAKFVEFETLVRPEEMIGQQRAILDWPYREGLRLDEAMHPLTLLTVGMYGRVLPNQNGAPVRVVVPWKYGFKSAKSLVRIRVVDRQPLNSWNRAAPQEYGFYSNVNPTVDHPRWSQATERRIGEFRRRKTLMFNGYGDQVASLYAGMDLKKNY